jgi:hypothetical protein
MNLNVYIDGDTKSSSYNLSMPALVKHLALSGCHYMPNMQIFFRCIGMFFHYGYYLQKESLDNDRFSTPDCVPDPSEKAQFSNLAGKAIADFLSKRIDNSMFTVNYESEMGKKDLPIKGQRPDLLAFTTNSMFAIEAKGYSKSVKNMEKHIEQSQYGEIPVDFCVASVSYNLYQKVKCKYYRSSSLNKNGIERNELLKTLSKKYYSGFLDFLKFKNEDELLCLKENFYKIDLYKCFEEFSLKICWKNIFNFHGIKLIIPEKIENYAEKGLYNDNDDNITPFEVYSNENIYIDKDRIGIELNCNKG